MSVSSLVNVQAIRGRFEQLHDVSNKNNPTLSQNQQFNRKVIQSDVSSHAEPISLHGQVSDNFFGFTKEAYASSENQSLPLSYSIGNSKSKISTLQESNNNELLPKEVKLNNRENSSDDKTHPSKPHFVCHPDQDLTSSKKVNQRKGSRFDIFGIMKSEHNSERLRSSSENLNNNLSNSFTEKQKIVESIVSNITKPENGCKINKSKTKNQTLTSNSDSPKSFTSRLEKDIKNVLELGVKSKKLVTIFDKQVHSKKKSETLENDSKFVFKKDSKNNVKRHSFSGHSTKPKNSNCDANYSQEYQNIYSLDHRNQLEFKESKTSNDSLKTVENCLENHAKTTDGTLKFNDFSNPIRPPRKSKKQKIRLSKSLSTYDNIYPGPLALNEKSFLVSEKTQLGNKDCSQITQDCNQFEHSYSIEYLDTRCDNESHDIDNTDASNDNISGELMENYDITEMSKELSSSDAFINKQTHSPPKKPPRTFAHDIYKSLKSQNILFPGNKCSLPKLPTKLTETEIDSLYTKPLKRSERKPDLPTTQPPPLRRRRTVDVQKIQNAQNKPDIAPKPSNLMEKARQRLSVIEPLQSPPDTKDVPKPIKRNSSLRLSYRNSEEIPPVLTRKESPVRRKIRLSTQNIRLRQHESDANSHMTSSSFQNSNCQIQDSDSPIYSTPHQANGKQREELHYMCSPLFNNTTSNSRPVSYPVRNRRLREMRPEDPSMKKINFKDRLKILGNLKLDFRQSYRNVQRRIQGSSIRRTR